MISLTDFIKKKTRMKSGYKFILSFGYEGKLLEIITKPNEFCFVYKLDPLS